MSGSSVSLCDWNLLALWDTKSLCVFNRSVSTAKPGVLFANVVLLSILRESNVAGDLNGVVEAPKGTG